MKKKPAVFILSALVCCLLYNSCKKDTSSSIETLLASGAWEVASIRAYNYIGDTQQKTDTLNKNCNFKQVFTFKTDKSCTYTNYQCKEQTTTGSWSLSRDRLFLIADIAFQDTLTKTTTTPFQNTKILNLGQYSLVVQTGDLQTNYGPKQVRRIVQYGFIRQKNPVK